MKTIDVFSYNGEDDILELRLRILNDYVDEFVICEGRETTAGEPKDLYFLSAKKRFEPWLHKIKYHVFSPYTDPIMQAFSQAYLPIPIEQHWWHREFIQKESMRFALTHLNDDDRVFVGDVDEIWDPLVEYPEGRAELQQTVYTYYLNNKSNEQWTGTSLMRYSDIKKDTLDNLRAYDEARKHMHAPIIKSGWHFTHCYGMDNYVKIKKKIESYAHQEVNHPAIKDALPYRIANNQDYLGRNFIFTLDESDWPEYLKQNKHEYKHLLRTNNGTEVLG